MRLKDKIAVITGAASGIGFACARLFAREGAKVVIGDNDGVKGPVAAKAIEDDERVRQGGGEAVFRLCDVGDKAQASALVEQTVETFGGLDILINNAGIIHTAEFLDLSEDDFERVLRVNLKGAFLAGQAAARWMVKQGKGGAIINMSRTMSACAKAAARPCSVSATWATRRRPRRLFRRRWRRSAASTS